mmetsp:Transcript_123276/g.343237  ORF Transcript_123276/g.343237 Transcript_123276/m.343237 type:complete len:438 (-) Transcript_123276:178-1491(-)
MAALTLRHIENIGLAVPTAHVNLHRVRPGISPAMSAPQTTSAADADIFKQALDEALSSALTKFDSLEVYFAAGQSPVDVTDMLVDELQSDCELTSLLDNAEKVEALRTFIHSAVGPRFGKWKKGGGKVVKSQTSAQGKAVPLPWSSIDSYVDWVLDKIGTFAMAEPAERDAARDFLEDTLLRKPVIAASVKYDGTCFGKMDNGTLAGRKLVLGERCREYLHTSTKPAESCDAAALCQSLQEICRVRIDQLCIWGELMCNPNFYDYAKRGLANKWICFGVVVALAEVDEAVSRRLADRKFAHSLNPSGRQLRLMLCPALQQLLAEVAHCDVAEASFGGLSHAEVVAQTAETLRSGVNEGVVLVFERSNCQTSLRKWKNSAEGASARKKEAQLLKDCHSLCASLVSDGHLDPRVAEMVETMWSVAADTTSPLKKGRKAK